MTFPVTVVTTPAGDIGFVPGSHVDQYDALKSDSDVTLSASSGYAVGWDPDEVVGSGLSIDGHTGIWVSVAVTSDGKVVSNWSGDLDVQQVTFKGDGSMKKKRIKPGRLLDEVIKVVQEAAAEVRTPEYVERVRQYRLLEEYAGSYQTLVLARERTAKAEAHERERAAETAQLREALLALGLEDSVTAREATLRTGLDG